MRSTCRDGDRVREVELTPLAEGRYRVAVDGAEFELSAEPLGEGRFRLTRDGVATLVEVGAAGECRFVRVGALDFVLARQRAGTRRGRAGAACLGYQVAA